VAWTKATLEELRAARSRLVLRWPMPSSPAAAGKSTQLAKRELGT
jgi:hypothetical protein